MEEPHSYPEWVTTESERKLHDDFRYFIWLIWAHLNLPPPTRRQLAIARYLQNGPRRRMVQAFRGVGKSWLTAAYVLWRLYRNPNERIMVVSANEDKAIEFATFVRRLIEEIEQLQFLRPAPGQRDSVLAFDVGPSQADPAPSVRAVGISGQLTGGRATIIVSDDVEVPKNSWTETMREKLAEQIKEYDAVLKPNGEIIYLGTPQSAESIYNKLPERGYEIRIWPARYPSPEEREKYTHGQLADDILADLAADPGLVGRTTDPERFSDMDLAEREASYGRAGFRLQFMLDTSLSDAERYPLKLSDLIVMDVPADQGPVRVEWMRDPQRIISDLQNPGFAGDRFYLPFHVSAERAAWQGTVMVIDPSGRGADETGYAVVRSLNGMLYLVASGGFRSGYSDETLEGLVMLAKEHKVTQVQIESNFGDGMFQKLIEPWFTRLYPCAIEENRVSVQKERRIIDDLEPVLNQHRLVVDRKVVEEDLKTEEIKYSLFYQLTHLTAERGCLRHDDRLDALAAACRYFRESLARDIKRAEEEHKRKIREKELDEWLRNAGKAGVRQTRYQRVASVLTQRPKRGSPRAPLGRR